MKKYKEFINETVKLKPGSKEHMAHHIDKYFHHTKKADSMKSSRGLNNHMKTAEIHLKKVHSSNKHMHGYYKSHRDMDPHRYSSGKDFASYEHPHGKNYK